MYVCIYVCMYVCTYDVCMHVRVTLLLIVGQVPAIPHILGQHMYFCIYVCVYVCFYVLHVCMCASPLVGGWPSPPFPHITKSLDPGGVQGAIYILICISIRI